MSLHEIYAPAVFADVPWDGSILGQGWTRPRPRMAHESPQVTVKEVKQDRVYRFGQCELRVARRELLVDGAVHLVEPKVFDVLVFLIEQRARVVSKAELLDRVWKNQFVSVGVIARAVMKARQAICDRGEVPALIGTVPRVGYRFIGEIDAPTGRATPPVPTMSVTPSMRPGTVSLALLPFENQTGQPEMDWIELGLMSMVAKSLSEGSRVSVPPIASLLSALNAMSGPGLVADRVGVVRELLHVRQVVHVVVSKDGSEYVLDYSIAPQAAFHRLRGPDLIPLSRLLVWALEAAMFSVGLD